MCTVESTPIRCPRKLRLQPRLRKSRRHRCVPEPQRFHGRHERYETVRPRRRAGLAGVGHEAKCGGCFVQFMKICNGRDVRIDEGGIEEMVL